MKFWHLYAHVTRITLLLTYCVLGLFSFISGLLLSICKTCVAKRAVAGRKKAENKRKKEALKADIERALARAAKAEQALSELEAE